MMSASLVVAVSFAYLLLLFAVASFGDARARQGRSIIGSSWVYALSLGVYCTAWTYFGSVGRAAASGVWFLPIYLGPTLAMMLAWMVVRKMIRIAKTYRITSIADFVASRYGKSQVLAGLVTLITVVGIIPYIALQLKAISRGFDLLTDASSRSFPGSRCIPLAGQHALLRPRASPASRSCSARGNWTALSAMRAWLRPSPSSPSSSWSLSRPSGSSSAMDCSMADRHLPAGNGGSRTPRPAFAPDPQMPSPTGSGSP
jgi:hypothetical protein